MTPQTVNVICAKSKHPCVPAVRTYDVNPYRIVWRCSFCGARVKVVA